MVDDSGVSGAGTGRTGGARRWPKAVLAVGYLGLLVGVLAARTRPATGYELSIYRATPPVFWVGVGLALGAVLAVAGLAVARAAGPDDGGTQRAVVGSVHGRASGSAPVQRRVTGAALLLLGSTVVSLVGLPVIRGYHSYGGGDTLSHLGSIRRIAAGTGSPLDLLYPGIHSVAVVLSGVGGSLTWAMMLTVVAFFVAFLVFVPLCVRAVLGPGPGVVVGALAAALVLPIDNVSVHPLAHPSSMGILLLPLVLFVVFAYLVGPGIGSGLRPTAIGAVLALVSTGIVLVHPQQAANALAAFAVVAGVGAVARRVRPDNPVAGHRRLYAQTGLLAAVFVGWSARYPRVRATATSLVERVVGAAEVANEVSQRSESLSSVGGSIGELFVKLYLVGSVFAALALAFGLAYLLGLFDTDRLERPGLVAYLLGAAVPVFVLFVAFFAASYTTQHFRYVGALLALVTVLGAAGLAHAADRFREVAPSRWAGAAVAVFFAVCLVLSAAAVHPSPYVYRSSPTMTESRMTGHATAFESRAPGVGIAGIRGGPRRFAESVYGRETPAAEAVTRGPEVVPGPYFNNGSVRAFFEDRQYLVVERADRLREVRLYEGFRYSEAGFRRVRATPGIDRVQTNGEFELYLVDGRRRANATDAAAGTRATDATDASDEAGTVDPVATPGGTGPVAP